MIWGDEALKKAVSIIIFSIIILLLICNISFCIYGFVDISNTYKILENTPGTSGMDYFGIGWVLGIGLFLFSFFGLLLSIISSKIAQEKVIMYTSYIMILLFSLLLILGVVVFYI